MKARAKALVALTAIALVAGAAAPEVPTSVGTVAQLAAEVAQAGPKDASGGSRAEQAGENAADLLQGWLGPLLLIVIGALAFVALMQRNVGMAVSVAMIGLIGGLFIFAPGDAESLFKGIYDALF